MMVTIIMPAGMPSQMHQVGYAQQIWKLFMPLYSSLTKA